MVLWVFLVSVACVAVVVSVLLLLGARLVRRYRSGESLSANELRLLGWISQPVQVRGMAAVIRQQQQGGGRVLSVGTVDCQSFVLGAAIGDAVGAGVEMQDAAWMRQHRHEWSSRLVNMRDRRYGINYAPGRYTDDCEHVVANVKVLIHNGGAGGAGLSEASLLQAYVAEYERSRNWLGIGRQGHGSILAYLEDPAPHVIDRIRLRQGGKKRPGNAPVMRGAVFGLIKDDATLKKAAYANANVTHPHTLARLASVATALSLRYLAVEQRTPNELIQSICSWLQEHCADEDGLKEFIEYLCRIDKMPSFKRGPIDRITLVGSVKGLPCSAMETAGAAIYFLKHSMDEPFQMLLQCLELGGDVDSVASVALSIAGAAGKIAFQDFPAWTYDSLEDAPYLMQIGQRLQQWYEAGGACLLNL